MEIRRYLADAGLRSSTTETYRRNLKNFDAWLQAEGIDEADFDGLDFEHYVESEHSNWKTNTRRACLFAIRGYIRWKYGDDPRDHPIVTKNIEREDPGAQPVLSWEQALEVLDAIDRQTDKGIRDYAMLAIMLATGWRASEPGKLRLSGIDWEANRISFIQKGGRQSTRVLSQEIMRDLKSWIDIRPKYAEHGSDFVFVSLGPRNAGKPLTRHAIRGIFEELETIVGFHIYPHMLRRTFAVSSLQRGASMIQVARQGGWASVHMVERYGRTITSEDYRDFLPTFEGREDDIADAA